MKQFEYAVHLEAAEEGGFVVTCRDLPALVTQGEDQADALAQAADAMDEIFASYMEAGLAFPAPSEARAGEFRVSPPAETVAKAALLAASVSRHIDAIAAVIEADAGEALPDLRQALLEAKAGEGRITMPQDFQQRLDDAKSTPSP